MLVGVGDLLAHQIFAGDAEMGFAQGQPARNLGSGEIGDFRAFDSGDGAAIVARAASLRQLQAGAREEGGGVLLQPAF